jgi:hypothetical protein
LNNLKILYFASISPFAIPHKILLANSRNPYYVVLFSPLPNWGEGLGVRARELS